MAKTKSDGAAAARTAPSPKAPKPPKEPKAPKQAKMNGNGAPKLEDERRDFAARTCVYCDATLPMPDLVGATRCAECRKNANLELCEHLARRTVFRITRFHALGAIRKSVVAVTVGDVTVHLGRFRDDLSLRAEDGSRLPLVANVRSIEPGSEIVERMTLLGTCYRCHVAFFLADCEIATDGPPRILRVHVDQPTRQYMRPTIDPVRVAAAYRTLGQRAEPLDEGEGAEP